MMKYIAEVVLISTGELAKLLSLDRIQLPLVSQVANRKLSGNASCSRSDQMENSDGFYVSFQSFI